MSDFKPVHLSKPGFLFFATPRRLAGRFHGRPLRIHCFSRSAIFLLCFAAEFSRSSHALSLLVFRFLNLCFCHLLRLCCCHFCHFYLCTQVSNALVPHPLGVLCLRILRSLSYSPISWVSFLCIPASSLHLLLQLAYTELLGVWIRCGAKFEGCGFMLVDGVASVHNCILRKECDALISGKLFDTTLSRNMCCLQSCPFIQFHPFCVA